MLQHILVAVGFDDLSDAVIDHAVAVARAMDGHCRLLHVIETIGDDDGDEDLEDFYSNLRAKAAEKMRAFAARLEEEQVPCETEIRVGSRWRTVIEVAEEHDVDLVVLGSRPMDPKERGAVGTTSHKVFFASGHPLLVVRG